MMWPRVTSKNRMLYLFVAVALCVPQAVAAQDDETDGDGAADEEEYVEPDAWERPPQEEEKAPEKPATIDDPEPLPGDGRRIQIGLNLGWGFASEKPKAFASDAWNFSPGLRGGYTMPVGLYAGLFYDFSIGENDTSGQIIAVEWGFDWWIEGVIVRPSIDLGAAIVSGPDPSGTNPTKTQGTFYMGPGVALMVPIDSLYVGGEIRQAVITGNMQSATFVAASFGLRL